MSKIKKRIVEILNYVYNKKRVRMLQNAKFDRLCYFEGHNSIGSNSVLKRCHIGEGTYIGANNHFTNIRIGRFCSIASNVRIVAGNHPTSIFVSTHPAFFSEKTRSAGFTFCSKTLYDDQKKTESGWFAEIGNDVWIGENVTILGGVKIGDGAVIGACSLVTHDIPPYSICVGIPAHVIKYRFSDSQISYLLKFKWWERDWKWIEDNAYLFSKVDTFIESQDN